MTDLLKHRILTLKLREDAPFPSECKAERNAIQEKRNVRLTLIRPLHLVRPSLPVCNDDSFNPEVA